MILVAHWHQSFWRLFVQEIFPPIDQLCHYCLLLSNTQWPNLFLLVFVFINVFRSSETTEYYFFFHFGSLFVSMICCVNSIWNNDSSCGCMTLEYIIQSKEKVVVCHISPFWENSYMLLLILLCHISFGTEIMSSMKF